MTLVGHHEPGDLTRGELPVAGTVLGIANPNSTANGATHTRPMTFPSLPPV
ncbi:hypothetical protein DFR69_10536 [Nocardia neocaledoniensis]|uniref:Uncharacterized protein n=1 Tax=Nocardia neocaledoniensis TaxID=236511 RepID=A0A317NIP3_9NOCA|nr:hypothetical protein DFR69_10536 [Nocardia neocaledoniensis]